MKRTSLINLSIVTGLLALCVMTLIAVYAMEPESSTILLFEDNLNALDQTKWEHLVSKCEGNGSQFHYSTADQESGEAQDTALHTSPTAEEENIRSRRSIALTECPPCIGSENGDMECVPRVFALQTRHLFLVNNGRLEVRAKLPKGSWTTYSIGMSPNASLEDTASHELYIINVINNGNENDAKQIRLSLGLDANHTTVHRNISSGEFHVFEIEWTENGIVFKIDSQVILKKATEFSDVRNRNSSRPNENLITGWALNEPFYLSLSAGVDEKHFQNSDEKRSSSNSTNESSSPVGDILQVDYIRLIKIS